MNENVRSLLDEAVADVRPRDTDPTTRVMRRGRQARLLRAAASGAACLVAVALIATGGFVAANRTATQVATAGSAPSEAVRKDLEPPRLDAEVADGAVRTGGLTVPIPKGWRLLRDQKVAYCKIPQDSVLINVMEIPGGNCDLHPQMSLSYWEPTTPHAVVTSEGRVSEVILPGGQPLWLTPNEVNNVQVTKQRDFAGASLAMPWANARVAVDAEEAQFYAILRGVRSDPVVPGRLAIPEKFSTIKLNVKGRKLVTSTDKAVATQVRALLNGLDQPVQDGDLPCPGAKELTPTWRLAGADMAVLSFISSRPSSRSPSTPFVTGMVAISSTDGCAFATSSLGGRVHLPAGTLVQIQHLLGDS